MKRADIQKWARVASPNANLRSQSEAIRVRDLPGVRDLENRLLMNSRDRHRSEWDIATVCRTVFGIDPTEVDYHPPDHYWELPENSPERIRMCEDYYDQFDAHDGLTDDETVDVMMGLGFDFSDERGHPLRCTKAIARVAEAAVKGIVGQMPDRQAATVENWGDALKREAEAFLVKKRRA